MKKIARIRSGGQTGVSRAALDTAQEFELQVCGWCPRGGLSDDNADILGEYDLKETDSRSHKERIEWNVRDSHATLIISPKGVESEGTELTELMVKTYSRPFHVVRGMNDIDSTVHWLGCLGECITLNVAGPKASESDIAYLLTRHFMEELLERVNG